ncbi:MAG: hypothetical protein GY754_08265 [bacterium]|nr:hypothetical protein [bacterium]
MKNLLAVLIVLATTGILFAGLYSGTEVHIEIKTSGESFAHGAFEAVRDSSDSVQYIQCYTTSDTFTMCQARDKNSNYLSGYSSQPEIAEMVKAMTKSSKITFWVSVDTGELVRISVKNGSPYIE